VRAKAPEALRIARRMLGREHASIAFAAQSVLYSLVTAETKTRMRDAVRACLAVRRTYGGTGTRCLKECIRDHVQALPAGECEVAAMVLILGMPRDTVASETETSISNVKRLVSRVRAQVASMYAENLLQAVA
jgi:hypothetical protein